MHLNIRGTQHPIRPGINVIGSENNSRYNTVLLLDKSICPKHASIRFDLASNKLEVLDLCSLHGVSVDQEPIAPLRWTEISTRNRLYFGDIDVSVVDGETQRNDVSLFMDEDSKDYIDCSLEELPSLQGTKNGTKTVSDIVSRDTPTDGCSLMGVIPTVQEPPASAKDKKEDRRSSFLVPCTQRLEESVLSATDNRVSSPSSKTGQDQLADDEEDDLFFIPETQQPDDELECPSDILQPVLPGLVRQDGPTERATADEEYFQMAADNDDDNSNDAVFNNKYIEESQNLMSNLDESYFQAGLEKGMSIVPERSVDSMSFQEHRPNTTQDMSRIEWNESNADKPQPTATKNVDPDGRSITPELHFDGDPPKTDERQASVTPEILYEAGPDALPAPLEADNDKPENRARETPVLCFDEQNNAIDDNEHEISLNQEGFFKVPTAAASTAVVVKPKEVAPNVDNVYDIETQAFDDAGGGNDAYGLQTQPLYVVQERSISTVSADSSPLKPYELATQPLHVVQKRSITTVTAHLSPRDPYELATQPVEKKLKSLRLPNRAFSPIEKCVEKATTPPADPMSRSRSSLQESMLEIDADDLLTQRLSPPKHVDDNDEESPAEVGLEAYNLQTQPFAAPPIPPGSGKKIFPFVKLHDIMANSRQASKSNDSSDPYAMETQLLVRDCSVNVYDLSTQKLPSLSHRVSTAIGDVTHFNPQINSTVRMSDIPKHQQQQQHLQPDLEVSPTTSNKENSTMGGNLEESAASDDGISLAETIPIGNLFPTAAKNSGQFKVPASKVEKVEKTPKPTRDRKRVEVDMTEFLTPEHPMVYLPKADRIRSASGQMRELAASHSIDAANKPKYHFNDNSSSSDEEHSAQRNVFKKTNVSVALERELEKVREDGKMQKKQKEQKEQHKTSEEKPDKSKAGKVKHRDEGSNKRISSSSSGTKRKEESSSHTKTSSHSTATKSGTKTERNPSKRKEVSDSDWKPQVEKKSSRSTRSKESETEQSSHKSDSNSSNDCIVKLPERVSTRIRRETYKQKAINESVDYQSKASKSNEEVVSSSRQTRKRREASTEETVIQPKPRESKRQKSGHGSTAPVVGTGAVETRPRRTAATSSGSGSKKVAK